MATNNNYTGGIAPTNTGSMQNNISTPAGATNTGSIQNTIGPGPNAATYTGGTGPTNTSSPLSTFGNPQSFTAGATTQASDYDNIMQSYGNIANQAANNPITATSVGTTPVGASTSNYTQSGDVTNSLSDLSNMATTGGYTAAGIADIRARDVSPTRSIYANAQQNLNQARAQGGGYSPNMAAATASMARDESNQISGEDTATNAGIAQNVAANELAGSQAYAGASETAQGQQQQNQQFNANQTQQAAEINQANKTQTGEFNTQEALNAAQANRQAQLAATQGQTGLYGTTPALTSTFGNQVMQATQAGQNQQQINNQQQKNIFGMAGGY